MSKKFRNSLQTERHPQKKVRRGSRSLRQMATVTAALAALGILLR
jgi:hypothetical protein